ncbi:MAG: hypothetical protein AB7L17_16065 [Ilumatobacteraceae bacterium]
MLAAACSNGGNEVAPVSFEDRPVATAPPATGVLSTPATGQPVAPTTQVVAEPTSTTPTTTLDPATTTTGTTDGVTGPSFSDDLGVKVDTAPGVHTVGDTRQLLPEGLYVHIAWQRDPNDLSVFTARAEDIEILEAYANAAATFHRAATSTVTIDSPDFARFYVDAGAQYESNFRAAREGGYVGNLGDGVVLRPYVLHDQSSVSRALVLDCTIDDAEFVLKDGGVPSSDPPQRKGLVATLRLIGGDWKVEATGPEPSACL